MSHAQPSWRNLPSTLLGKQTQIANAGCRLLDGNPGSSERGLGHC
jgi:hypothetical protein